MDETRHYETTPENAKKPYFFTYLLAERGKTFRATIAHRHSGGFPEIMKRIYRKTTKEQAIAEIEDFCKTHARIHSNFHSNN